MGFAANRSSTQLRRRVLTNTFLILFTMVFILLEAVESWVLKRRAAFGTESAQVFDEARVNSCDNLGRYLGIKTIVSLA